MYAFGLSKFLIQWKVSLWLAHVWWMYIFRTLLVDYVDTYTKYEKKNRFVNELETIGWKFWTNGHCAAIDNFKAKEHACFCVREQPSDTLHRATESHRNRNWGNGQSVKRKCDQTECRRIETQTNEGLLIVFVFALFQFYLRLQWMVRGGLCAQSSNTSRYNRRQVTCDTITRGCFPFVSLLAKVFAATTINDVRDNATAAVHSSIALFFFVCPSSCSVATKATSAHSFSSDVSWILSHDFFQQIAWNISNPHCLKQEIRHTLTRKIEWSDDTLLANKDELCDTRTLHEWNLFGLLRNVSGSHTKSSSWSRRHKINHFTCALSSQHQQ